MDAYTLNANTLVLSTAPYNFAGAGTAHAQILELLASAGASVQFWTPKPPFRANNLVEAGVEIVTSTSTSDAYPESDVIIYGVVANSLVRSATAWLEAENANRVILFSTYLFPFCMAVEIAAKALHRFASRVQCIIHPAGSDIWQIAKQMPHIAKLLIDSSHVTGVVTYSTRFADEIKTTTGSVRRIEVIPPPIDVLKFYPMTPTQRIAARHEAGIGNNEFVISHCSNLRPVKGIHHVIEIAAKFASIVTDDVRLLMVGPITRHLSQALSLVGLPSPEESVSYEQKLGNLYITCTGLQKDVRKYHAISDVALNTSLHDSFNISLGEAMACEVPVLTSNVAGIASLVDEYECGGTFPFEFNPIYDDNMPDLSSNSSEIQVDAVLEWLINFWRNGANRIEMGRRSRIAIVDHCSDSVIAKRWYELCGLSQTTPANHIAAVK